MAPPERSSLRRSGHPPAGAVIHPPERSFSTEVVKGEQHASTRRARARATRKNRGVLSRPGSGRSARACVPAEGVTAARNAPLGAGASGTKAINRYPEGDTKHLTSQNILSRDKIDGLVPSRFP